MTTLLEGSDLVVAAKNIRAELKAAFPGVKFSVRTDRFSMGDSIDISWTDGPTSKSVEDITGKYQDGHFDGMTDSYEYTNREWTRKHGGAKFVHTHRHYSNAIVVKAIEALVAEYGAYNVPTPDDYQSGRAYNTTPMGGDNVSDHWSWQSLINRKLSETAA